MYLIASLIILIRNKYNKSTKYPLFFPRTRKNLKSYNLLPILENSKSLKLNNPFSYIPFMNLVFNSGLVITDSEGKEKLIEADTIVLAAGTLPNRELYEALKGKFEVKLAGDSSEPRSIREAIHEGFEAGFDIP